MNTELGIGIVIPCFNLGRTLEEALDSARSQTRAPSEIVVVDDGSQDPYTRQVLARLASSGTNVVSTANRGPAAARNLGIRLTTAPLLVLLDADDALEPSYLEKATAELEARSDLGFVSCGLRAFGNASYVWIPPPCTFVDTLVRGGVHVSTTFRREIFDAVGGFDERLPAYEDTDFWLAALERGYVGHVLQEPLVRYRVRTGSRYHQALRPEVYLHAKRRILEKHAASVEAHRDEILAGLEAFAHEMREHARHLEDVTRTANSDLSAINEQIAGTEAALAAAALEPLDWGVLRRVQPIAASERRREGGIEAHYIKTFLAGHETDLRGTVLRVGARGNDALRELDKLDRAAPNSFDAVLLLDVLRYASDPLLVVRRVHAALKPGGVLLATMLCAAPVTRYHGQDDEDRWRFTEASARRLLSDVFSVEDVHVTTFGNLLACVASLHGLDATELATAELEHRDPWFPLVVCARAVKARVTTMAPAVHLGNGAGAAVLLYHRIASLAPDTHGLCVAPEEFERQMEHVRRAYRPLDLREIAQLSQSGRIPSGAVAVTFDDGYLDNLTVASEILSGLGIPATFFVNTEDVEVEHEAWWDTVERIFISDESLPPVLELASVNGRRSIPTAMLSERQAAILDLHGVLLYADVDERARIMEELVRWSEATLPVRPTHRLMTAPEIVELSRRPGHAVGAHTTHHLLLPAHPIETQRREVAGNRADLERILGHRVASFSYPYGELAPETVQIVRDVDFELAVTVDPDLVRPGTDRYRVPRLEVKPSTFPSFTERMAELLKGHARTNA